MAKKNSPATAAKAPPKKVAPAKAASGKNAGALRFAHPFFTTKPKAKRATIKGVGKGLAE